MTHPSSGDVASPVNDCSKGLLSLPNEIIFQITKGFSFRELSRLARTSRHLTAPMERELYSREVKIGDTTLAWSLRQGFFRAAQNAITYGANVKKIDQGHSMLELAIMNSSDDETKIIEQLLEGGADPDFSNGGHERPLVLASKKRREGLMRLLLKNGANPNATGIGGMCALHILPLNFNTQAKSKIFALHRMLIDNGASANIQDSDGCTPLHIAVRSKNMEYVNLLLESGAESQIRNQQGETSFMLSLTMREQWSIKDRLLRHNSTLVGIPNWKGHTPLHWASARGFITEMKFLLKRGAFVNDVTLFKETPLHLALKMAKFDAVVVLMEARSDPNIKNTNGENVFCLCMKQLVITHKADYAYLLKFLLQNDPTDAEAREVFAKLHLYFYDTDRASECLKRKGIEPERFVEILPEAGIRP